MQTHVEGQYLIPQSLRRREGKLFSPTAPYYYYYSFSLYVQEHAAANATGSSLLSLPLLLLLLHPDYIRRGSVIHMCIQRRHFAIDIYERERGCHGVYTYTYIVMAVLQGAASKK